METPVNWVMPSIHIALSVTALVVLIGAFLVGAKYKLEAGNAGLATPCVIVGLIAGLIGVYDISSGSPLIWACAVFVGAFLTGVGLGLHVTERVD